MSPLRLASGGWIPPGKAAPALLTLLLTMLLAGCANQPVTDPIADPWEPFNRNIHAFNDGVDDAIVKPIAKGYDAIMPDAPQRGVRNFFNNLQYPVTFVNLLLQGKVNDSLTATGRFLMNSTLGLFGFFDVAGKAGMPEFDEDLGQTLGVWGWEDSRYLVVPFLGPFTVRDLGGRGIVGYFSPTAWIIREHDTYAPLILDLISLRASLLPLEPNIEASSDPYAFVRDAYLQRREFLIYDGDPPAPDYDALLED